MARSTLMITARKIVLIAGVCGLCILAVAVAIVKVEPNFRAIEPTFDELPPRPGDPAPEFTLRDVEGQEFHLSERMAEKKSVVIEFGSLSCPYCARQLDWLNDVAEKYHDRVLFLFVYTAEAHPNDAPIISNWDDRRKRARLVKNMVKENMRVLVDDFGAMSVQKLYGSTSNSGFVFGPDLRLIGKLPITTPMGVEEFLQKAGISSAPHS